MIANFGQLSAYDSNGDGQLSGAGTLESLSQAGIASITIQAQTTGSYDNGNLLSADSSFTKADGSTGDIADAFLMNGNVRPRQWHGLCHHRWPHHSGHRRQRGHAAHRHLGHHLHRLAKHADRRLSAWNAVLIGCGTSVSETGNGAPKGVSFRSSG